MFCKLKGMWNISIEELLGIEIGIYLEGVNDKGINGKI